MARSNFIAKIESPDPERAARNKEALEAMAKKAGLNSTNQLLLLLVEQAARETEGVKTFNVSSFKISAGRAK